METSLLSQKKGYGDDTEREVKDEEEIAKKSRPSMKQGLLSFETSDVHPRTQQSSFNDFLKSHDASLEISRSPEKSWSKPTPDILSTTIHRHYR